MAIFHLSMKNGSKGKAANHAAYISCARNYENKSDLAFRAVMNIPDFADNAIQFFEFADMHERGKSAPYVHNVEKNQDALEKVACGRAYREFELALPRELNLEQNKKIIGEWIDIAGLQNQPAIIALHKGKFDKNPHCHLMFSERPVTNEFDSERFFKRNGSKKERRFHDKSYVSEMRVEWETLVNRHLFEADIAQQISHKSLLAQGITDRLPQPKIGFAAQAIEARGELSTRVKKFDEVMQHNNAIIMRPVTELKASIDKQKLLMPSVKKVQKIKADLTALKKPRPKAKVLQDVKAYMKHASIKMHPLVRYNDALYRFKSAQRELANTPWYKPFLFIQNAFEMYSVSKQYDAAHAEWSPVHDKLDYARQSTNNELQMMHKQRVTRYDDTKASLEFELKHEVSELEAQFNVSFSELEDAVRPAVAVLEREQASMKLEAERRAESDFRAYEKQHQLENKPSDMDMC